MIRIASLETRIVNHPLVEERIVISPAGRHDLSRFLTVRVRDADGVTGYGEAATVALWSGETAETAQSLVENVFAPLLIGHSFEHPREILARLDVASYGNPFTKSAVDQAVWDVWARAQNLPATALFGDRPPLERLPTRASIGCYDPAKTAQIAQEFWDAGIRTLKFKVGLPQFDDVARLRAVRERLGDAPVFHIDANGAYGTVAEAVAAIENLLPFGVRVVEQPTPRDRISLLAQVKARVDVPIMADECIFTPGHLREALDLDAFDIVSLYPGKNGGLTHCLDMAALAQGAGKACSLGSNGETDLGQGAMIALASSLGAFPAENIICDLPAALFYQQSSVREPLIFADGQVAVPRGNGFGVEPLDL